MHKTYVHETDIPGHMHSIVTFNLNGHAVFVFKTYVHYSTTYGYAFLAFDKGSSHKCVKLKVIALNIIRTKQVCAHQVNLLQQKRFS